ncbi:MAG: hypothetical protein NVSMB19_25570 [Vulcanimicrobiaceae bacterium]
MKADEKKIIRKSISRALAVAAITQVTFGLYLVCSAILNVSEVIRLMRLREDDDAPAQRLRSQ